VPLHDLGLLQDGWLAHEAFEQKLGWLQHTLTKLVRCLSFTYGSGWQVPRRAAGHRPQPTHIAQRSQPNLPARNL